ncbi:hypothetical protein RB601_008031 [Gaeumannomyces tritici]
MLAAKILVAAMASLVAAVPALQPRQYTGPCETTNCGAQGLDCTHRGNLCVAFPHTDAALRKGCTCSVGR